MSAISSTNQRVFNEVNLNNGSDNGSIPSVNIEEIIGGLLRNEAIINWYTDLLAWHESQSRQFNDMYERVITAERAKELLRQENQELREKLNSAEKRTRKVEKREEKLETSLKDRIKRAKEAEEHAREIEKKAKEIYERVQKAEKQVVRINEMFKRSETERKALERLFKVQNDLGCRVNNLKRKRR